MMKKNEPKSMQAFWENSYLADGNEAYIESLYETYLKNPAELPDEWQNYFKSIGNQSDQSHSEIRSYFANLAKHPNLTPYRGSAVKSTAVDKQDKVIDLIAAYRNYGHLKANIDPLGLFKGIDNPTLDLNYYDFTEADLGRTFNVGTFHSLGKDNATLKEILDALKKTYCHTIGIEYTHIPELKEVSWIQERMERDWINNNPSKEQKLRILECLTAADGLEKYLGVKYVGQKRFSLEGGDSLIPLLDTLITQGSASGVKEIVIGMAHRGRLNVLMNIVGKEPKKIFDVFEDKKDESNYSGDVKYHLGFSSDVKTPYGFVHLSLAFNPSHLEIVSPVVQGSVRARQRRRKDSEQKQIMAVQIHGDAAFAGQGVVMETFQMSQARWFTVGGSVHIVINNQIGFTISNPRDARSGLYCTDVAKIVSAPILHVNGNDPEAVCFAAQLALDYHNKFKKDIVIDLVCYRRHGHNEADEPSATQPLMYKIIKAMPTPAVLYAQKLAQQSIVPTNFEKQLEQTYRKKLESGETLIELIKNEAYEYSNAWQSFIGQTWNSDAKTSIPLNKLQQIGKQLEVLPEGFVLQPQVKKMMEARQKMLAGDLPLNWGFAETMAYATLLEEGFPIRLCGQDASRGTFSHRHAVLHDQKTDEIYIPLSHVSTNQAQINIVDSLLSEEAVLAFEYGYASTVPDNFVLWEAQFGDFANGAQVVIDQFISSGEQKWGKLCGLVMLLPHGYEGMGPEHSSARLERYLQLCAQHNMQVCTPTTPSQIFHLLRRQMIRKYRTPLIIMSPKSILRHPLAVSSLKDLTNGQFELIIPEIDKLTDSKVTRLVLCSGKVYYDLLEKRREAKLENVAIIRIEQLYPFPEEALKSILKQYSNVTDIVWCQEEPQNQGAWFHIQHNLMQSIKQNQKIIYAGRQSSASPAVGSVGLHLKEQATLVAQALT